MILVLGKPNPVGSGQSLQWNLIILYDKRELVGQIRWIKTR
jgi:hypothetical protein